MMMTTILGLRSLLLISTLLGASRSFAFVMRPLSSSLSRHNLPTSNLNVQPFDSRNTGNISHSSFQTNLKLSSDEGGTAVASKKLPPYPKIGDVVRYTDLDGGRKDGQVLVGKISLIQPVLTSNPNEEKQWLLEISELDDMGDGYFGDYPMRERRFKKALRKLPEVSPVLASFVRSADAYKVPMDENKEPKPWYDQYRMDGYEGPTAVKIDQEVVESDAERYSDLKGMLIRDAAIVGAIGALFAQFGYGTEDALIYAAGALAGVGYLFFLSIKTDTLGSPTAKFGKTVSNLRFALPFFVLLGVAIKNIYGGDNKVGFETEGNIMNTVTKDQFGAAMIGFLTYRIPLFLRQLQPVLGDSVSDVLPGSAGMAMKMAQEAASQETEDLVSLTNTDLTTILLVCGPSGTGKTTLVKKLVSESQGRFIEPEWTDRNLAGAQFEVMDRRGDFLMVESSGRYGLSIDSVLNGVDKDSDKGQVIVVDADVELAKSLTRFEGVRIVGVWVGLDSIEKIQNRTKLQLESGEIKIPDGESADSVLRARVKKIVKDIEYGVISGIFEFTILNDDIEESVQELKAAAEYCFN